jgi:FKBP-type peptidyl-prolyl cis-trans isomerase
MKLKIISSTFIIIMGLTMAQCKKGKPLVEAIPATGELKIEDTKVGKGMEVGNHMRLAMHYVGKLEDGTQFDSSRKRGKPFIFTLGSGEVIKGWDAGIIGMHVGGKRRLTIPPHMAYGARGVRNMIPPNATLIFEVELVDIFM